MVYTNISIMKKRKKSSDTKKETSEATKSVYKRYENYKTSYKCVKTSLKSIVKDEETIVKINNIVCKMNKIISHTYHFLKLYCLYHFKKSNTVPYIDQHLIVLIMKTLCTSDTRGRKFSHTSINLKDNLDEFYINHYAPLINYDIKLSYTNLNQMLEYEATSVLTCLSNHIQEHFIDMLNRFINIVYNKKDSENTMTKEEKDKFRAQLKSIKNDIIFNENKSNNEQFVAIFRAIYLKDIIIDKPLSYVCKSDPMKLLIVMIRMSENGEIIELARKSKKIDDDKDKLFPVINCFPLRKSVIPKYVDLDTSIIISNLMTENKGYYGENGNKLKLCDEIWEMYFKTSKKVFNQKGYTFNRRIVTDGIGCSILLVRDDLFKPLKKTIVRTIKKPNGYTDDKYVDDLTEEEKIKCYTKNIVGADPGKNDLIYCTDGKVKMITKENGKIYRKANKMSYSQKLREETLKTRYYGQKIENDKRNRLVGNRDIKEIESELSKINSASCMYENVREYIKKKSKTNKLIQEYYEEEIHRRLKWYSFINKQKSDADMVERFKNKFGAPDKVVMLIGDWAQKRQMKYKAPTKGKSIRTLFKKHGYEVYLVDEHKTSCRLYETGEELIKIRKCHTLLGSKILTGRMDMANPKNGGDKLIKEMMECGYRPTVINRDLNGSLNIRLKGWLIINGLQEMKYMKYKNNAD
jgi:hypothetical protein